MQPQLLAISPAGNYAPFCHSIYSNLALFYILLLIISMHVWQNYGQFVLTLIFKDSKIKKNTDDRTFNGTVLRKIIDFLHIMPRMKFQINTKQ